MEIARNVESKALFVRVKYNFNDVLLPISGTEWTPFDQFKTLLESFVPENYTVDCDCDNVSSAALDDEIRATTSK